MNDLSFYSSVIRKGWRQRRAAMESAGHRFTRSGIRRKPRLLRFTLLVEPMIAASGLRRRALNNATALSVAEVDVPLRKLPRAFDGYRILQLSDLHVGRIAGLTDRAAGLVRELQVDLAVLTGDIQTWGTPSAAAASAEMAPLLDAIRASDGIFAVLGNHDAHDLVDHLEGQGVRMLINEHRTVIRDGTAIRLSGTDDVNCFYTDEAREALRAPTDAALSIALVHSPEIADMAADAGYALYLSGHTHGGQICMPNGRPLMTATDHHRALSSGLWRYGSMLGYTSRGVGVGRRARFNCPPEITVLRLRCAETSTAR
jgi:uncharacterized protein